MTDDPKTRILDAAEVVFADKGLAGARVAAIAEAADVNKAMLYYYFGSKEDLYRAVLGRVVTLVGQVARDALTGAEGDPVAQLEAFMDGYQRVLRIHTNLPRIMAREIIDGGPHVGLLFRDEVGPILPMVAMTLSRSQSAGVLNPDVHFPLAGPIVIAPFVFVAIARPILEQVLGPMTDEMLEEYSRTAKEIILNGLRARKEDA